MQEQKKAAFKRMRPFSNVMPEAAYLVLLPLPLPVKTHTGVRSM